jgi:hypothetical protein
VSSLSPGSSKLIYGGRKKERKKKKEREIVRESKRGRERE